MRARKIIFIMMLSLGILALHGQSLSLADFELETSGYIDPATDKALFPAYGTLSIRLVPVPWIRFQGRLDMLIPDTAMFLHPMPDSNEPGILAFKGGFVEFPDIGQTTYSVSVFTGYFDDPASGSLLRHLLKIDIPESEFQGKPGGIAFSPETGITGTGMALTALPYSRSTVLGAYGYWNTRTDENAKITADFRLGQAAGGLQFNLFSGVSYETEGSDFSLRGGVTSLFRNDSGNELFTQIGIRSFYPGKSGIDRNIYFLFEPRLYGERGDIAISFFSSPVFPENIPAYLTVNAESNYIGANILGALGNLETTGMRGGISFLGSIDPTDPGTITPFSFSISPFYSIMISDFLFDVTAVIKPLMLDEPQSIGELRLNLKAVY